MEDSSIDSGFDAPADLKFPIGIGILGIIIGGLGLIIAFMGRGKVERFTAKIDADLEEIRATVNKAAAEQGIGGESAQELDALRQELKLLQEQVARKFEAVDRKDESIEAALVTLDNRVNGRRNNAGTTSSGNNNRPADPAPANTGSNASGEYTVQTGDNFWKIANKLGCKPADIQDLNPDIDPSRLRVGQKIKVPAK